MKGIKINKAAIIKTSVFLILPIVLVLVAFYVYREYLFNNRYINKVILKKDMEFNFFTFDEMDSPTGSGDKNLPYYRRFGKNYITNSGKENFNPDTLKMLDDARGIIENEFNKANPNEKIVFVINSGYRSDSRNKEVGGVTNSAHRNKGDGSKAVDIKWSNYNKDQKQAIREALERVGFTRFGIANSFIHVDNDLTLPNPAVWTY